MCGIVGVLNLTDRPPVEKSTLYQMLAMIHHRGPDGIGIFRDANVGLGNTRLSIIDLSGGDQPISNEDGTLWIVFNGEIFNYVELRPQLEAQGHCFSTNTDTEVIVHLYEEYGHECLRYLNGQFAIALWDARDHSLFLARDRLGVRPLFYTINDGHLVFGSEIKALLAYPGIRAEIDPTALNQVFTFWSTLSPRSVFKNINDVPPGHYLLARNGQVNVQPYWTLDFSEDQDPTRKPADYLAELESLLIDATRIRLRADVPVGAYLSGGLDSSTTTAIVRKYTNTVLDTFSIAFADNPEFDESQFQLQMAKYLGTRHQVVYCTHADIGRAFPDVIWYTETPVLRTAPVPMFLLSKLVHDSHLKVVVTGEGADEFLAGYDIFKEMQIRRFWARKPQSEIRPLLFRRLYPDIVGLSTSWIYLKAFFERGLNNTDSPYYSHAVRWSNTARTQKFLRQPQEMSFEQIPLPSAFSHWSHLAQAQYLEITIFLSQYLLSSQGDRPAMAHSVEGRFPFLDYRVVEFCNRLPASLKLHGMTEKWLLKQIGRKLVPPEIWQRPKRPYRAPIHRSFFNANTPEYVYDLLSDESLQASELFHVPTVRQLVRKASSGARLSEVEDMAVAGVLSTQLVYQRFIKAFKVVPIRKYNRERVVDRITSEDE